MKQRIDIVTDPRTAVNDMLLRIAISTRLNIDVNRIKQVVVVRRSIDARQRIIKINLTLDLVIIIC